MPDYGSIVAEKAISQTVRKVREVYKQAYFEIRKKMDDFTKRYIAKNADMLEKLKSGEITKTAYDLWLKREVFIGKQWDSKLDQVMKIMNEANKEAVSIVNGRKLNVFSENYNFAAYDLEKEAKGAVSFNIYNETATAKLLKENPKLLPEWNINERKDYSWNRQKVENAITQGIIQGEGIDKITDRLTESLITQNDNRMRTFARTAITGAQNAGRQEEMEEAEELGVKLKKRWVATLDDRTRDTHQELDGQEVDVDDDFEVDGMEISYPGDPNAEPCLVYNCRCTMIQVYEDIDRKSVRRDQGNNLVENMTYKEWKEWKEGQGSTVQRESTGIVEDMRDKLKGYDEQLESHRGKLKELDDEYKNLYTESITKYGTDEYDKISERMNQVDQEIQEIRAEETKIQDERNTYLNTNGENEIITAFGKIDKPHDIEDDVVAVNRITEDERTQKNCGSCCLAYDARRRGINCQAELTYGVNNNEIESWWKGLKMQNVSSYYPSDAKHEIERAAESWGNGARGIVEIGFTPTTGHYMMFEVRNGQCIFVDGQSGIMHSDHIFDIAAPGDIRYGRTDNREITKKAIIYLRGGSVEQD